MPFATGCHFDTFIKTIRFLYIFKVRKQNLLHIKVYKLNLCNHENEIFICCVVPHDGLFIGRSAENLQISEHETIGRKAY